MFTAAEKSFLKTLKNNGYSKEEAKKALIQKRIQAAEMAGMQMMSGPSQAALAGSQAGIEEKDEVVEAEPTLGSKALGKITKFGSKLGEAASGVAEEVLAPAATAAWSAVAEVPEVGGRMLKGLQDFQFLPARGIDAIFGTDLWNEYQEGSSLGKYAKEAGDWTTELMDQGIEDVFGKNPKAKELGKTLTKLSPELAVWLAGGGVYKGVKAGLRAPGYVQKVVQTGKALANVLARSGAASVISAEIEEERLPTAGEVIDRATFDTLFTLGAAGLGVGVDKLKEAGAAAKFKSFVTETPKRVWEFIKGNPKPVRAALKGADTVDDVIDDIEKLYRKVKTVKSPQYATALKEIEKSKVTISKVAVRDKIIKLLKRYKITPNKAGQLTKESFINSNFKNNAGAIKKITTYWDDLINSADDLTFSKLEVLQQQIKGSPKELLDPSQSVEEGMRKIYKDLIDKAFPKMKAARQQYAEAMDFLKEMTKFKGLKDKTRAFSFIRNIFNKAKEKQLDYFKEFLDFAGDKAKIFERLQAIDAAKYIDKWIIPIKPTGMGGLLRTGVGAGGAAAVALKDPVTGAAALSALLATSPKLHGLAALSLAERQGLAYGISNLIQQVMKLEPAGKETVRTLLNKEIFPFIK